MRVVSALTEGNSLRATERMTGVCRPAIARLLLLMGAGCQRLHDTMLRELRCDVLELDEVWGYVAKKEARVREGDPPEYGDAYVWIGFDSVTKLVASYRVGKRSTDEARGFALDLRARIVGKPQITTDGFKPYIEAIESAFGVDVHYAQILKTYRGDEAGGASRDEVRYGRGRVLRSVKRVITGTPDQDRISTSLAERNNWQVRLHVRRMTRLSNGFSRKLECLRAAMALHFAAQNLCRVHGTLRTSPAMAAGVVPTLWSIGELVEAALAAPEAPPWPPLQLPPRPTKTVVPRELFSTNAANQLFLPGIAV